MTARHVVEGTNIREIRLTSTGLFYQSSLYSKKKAGSYTVGPDSPRITKDSRGVVQVEGPAMLHPNPLIDLAAVKVSGMGKNAHFVPLGGHLDDWVGEADFVLSEVIVMGYPPIPFSREPHLIVMKGEVSATVDLNLGGESQMHFIVSTMPRGGFSGGLVFSSWGFALGVVTQSLVENGNPAELGYASVISVEAIYDLLEAHKVLPTAQIEWLGYPWGGADRSR